MRCCVPGCTSNYDSTLKKGEPVITTFAFPKEESGITTWLRAIPRKDWTPTTSTVVCIKHFKDSDVDLYLNRKSEDGEMLKILMKCPKLKVNAVPTIFPNVPKYLTKVENLPRKDPEQRRNEVLKREQLKIEEFLNMDNIENFNTFVTTFASKVKCEEWHYKIYEGKFVLFYRMNIDYEVPSNCCDIEDVKIVTSILVFSNMTVKVQFNGNEISKHDLKWVLPHDVILRKWSQLENILTRYKNSNTSRELLSEREQLMKYISKAKLYLDMCKSLLENYDYANNIRIISNQLELLLNVKRRYYPTTILFSFIIFTQSPAAYQFLREHLILPTKRHLLYISSSLNVSPEKSNTSNYLKQVSINLSSRERYVNLLIDEVYVKSALSYKNNNVVGSAENMEQLAKTVLTYMISSCFGSFKEVVHLYPVKAIKGHDMKEITDHVIQFVQKSNFIVLSIITDNNRINQNMYRTMSNSEYLTNPNFENLEIYLTYDTVHIFKNIRNNWLNTTDFLHTFIYPDFENFNIERKACFGHLRELYEHEKTSIIKKCYKLNYKSLYPSKFERQNVLLVDNTFHCSTIAALTIDSKYSETVQFLEIINKWWNITNSKSIMKGIIKRNDWTGPISDLNDQKLAFLTKFLKWIQHWKMCAKNKTGLSNDTASALERNTIVLLKISEKAIKDLNIPYVLLGKFQSDYLERRFGKYRRLSGCNYNISYRQVLESEKKLRIKRILSFVRTNEIDLKTVVVNLNAESNSECSEIFNSDINLFRHILTTDYLDVCEIDEGSFIYVCGYLSSCLVKKLCCELCILHIRNAKGDNIGNVYFDYLQRGGLAIPTNEVISAMFNLYAIFDYIINNSELEATFLKLLNQKAVLLKLAMLSLNANSFFEDNFLKCYACGQCSKTLFMEMYKSFCNILLNNYTKQKNDRLQSIQTDGTKRRKLQTLI